MMTVRHPAARLFLTVLLAAASAAAGAWAGGLRERPASATAGSTATAPGVELPGVSVVELFTSEGCSSCPPADAALASLLAQARASGNSVYALGWHVGYWNDLGWKDPYTLKSATARQRRYAAKLSSSLYTPEIVVNGTRAAADAGNAGAVERLAAAARRRPALASVLLALQPGATAGQITVRVTTTGAPAGSSVTVALVEDGLVQRPDAGENAERTLRHDAVVRAASILPAAGGVAHLTLPSPSSGGPTRVIAFVQTRSLAIVGANEIDLRATAAAASRATLSGRLLGGSGGGVGGALVQACSTKLCLPVRTGPSGRFTVTGVPAGHYDVKLFLPTRTTEPLISLPVEVHAGEVIALPPLEVKT